MALRKLSAASLKAASQKPARSPSQKPRASPEQGTGFLESSHFPLNVTLPDLHHILFTSSFPLDSCLLKISSKHSLRIQRSRFQEPSRKLSTSNVLSCPGLSPAGFQHPRTGGEERFRPVHPHAQSHQGLETGALSSPVPNTKAGPSVARSSE